MGLCGYKGACGCSVETDEVCSWRTREDSGRPKKLGEGEGAPLDELLFQMLHNLCTLYGGSPMYLEREPYQDVIALYADVRRLQIRTEHESSGDHVIRRRASDDAGWW